MKIKILYEDKDILAIDKPSGILVHPDLRSKEKTILDLFLKKYPKIEIVHRLDKETSGVMLLAKNEKAHEFLKQQFKSRKIKKIYYAIVSGWPKKDHEIINKPIGRSPSDFRRRLAGRGARGELREAVTEYKVLKRFEVEVCQNFYPRGSRFVSLNAPKEGRRGKNIGTPERVSLLEIHPKTGRTHQIRVHMKYINHPVADDALYDPKGPKIKGLERLALHAKSIEFKGLNGKIIKIESKIPKEFDKIIGKI